MTIFYPATLLIIFRPINSELLRSYRVSSSSNEKTAEIYDLQGFSMPKEISFSCQYTSHVTHLGVEGIFKQTFL